MIGCSFIMMLSLIVVFRCSLLARVVRRLRVPFSFQSITSPPCSPCCSPCCSPRCSLFLILRLVGLPVCADEPYFLPMFFCSYSRSFFSLFLPLTSSTLTGLLPLVGCCQAISAYPVDLFPSPSAG